MPEECKYMTSLLSVIMRRSPRLFPRYIDICSPPQSSNCSRGTRARNSKVKVVPWPHPRPACSWSFTETKWEAHATGMITRRILSPGRLIIDMYEFKNRVGGLQEDNKIFLILLNTPTLVLPFPLSRSQNACSSSPVSVMMAPGILSSWILDILFEFTLWERSLPLAIVYSSSCGTSRLSVVDIGIHCSVPEGVDVLLMLSDAHIVAAKNSAHPHSLTYDWINSPHQGRG